jgi:hypothetical protein
MRWNKAVVLILAQTGRLRSLSSLCLHIGRLMPMIPVRGRYLSSAELSGFLIE